VLKARVRYEASNSGGYSRIFPACPGSAGCHSEAVAEQLQQEYDRLLELSEASFQSELQRKVLGVAGNAPTAHQACCISTVVHTANALDVVLALLNACNAHRGPWVTCALQAAPPWQMPLPRQSDVHLQQLQHVGQGWLARSGHQPAAAAPRQACAQQLTRALEPSRGSERQLQQVLTPGPTLLHPAQEDVRSQLMMAAQAWGLMQTQAQLPHRAALH
jgi:hypothetical protein